MVWTYKSIKNVFVAFSLPDPRQPKVENTSICWQAFKRSKFQYYTTKDFCIKIYRWNETEVGMFFFAEKFVQPLYKQYGIFHEHVKHLQYTKEIEAKTFVEINRAMRAMTICTK